MPSKDRNKKARVKSKWAELTEDEKNYARMREAARRRKSRAALPKERRQELQLTDAEAHRVRLEQLSEEERQEHRLALAGRQRNRRQNLSQEKIEDLKRADTEAHRARLAELSEDERQEYRLALAAKQRNRRQSLSQEKIEDLKRADAKAHRTARAALTDEERWKGQKVDTARRRRATAVRRDTVQKVQFPYIPDSAELQKNVDSFCEATSQAGVGIYGTCSLSLSRLQP